MADEPQQDPNTISVQDAIRLKHQLGKNITWGNSNLNALQVEQLTKLTAEDYARIRKEYKDWQKRVTVFNNYVLIAIGVACAVAYYFIQSGWVRVPVVIIALNCFVALCRREGHAEGYVEGYDAGREEGIHKALGIKPEELSEMHEFATEMKIDGMLIQKMDEREE